MSANCNTPPGRNTRQISVNACRLSATRFSTPFAITTSAQPSSTGSSSATPGRNSTFVVLSCCPTSRAREHLRRHLDTDNSALGTDSLGGEQAVHPCAGAHVDDVFTRREASKREGTRNARERLDSLVGQRIHESGVVAAARRQATARMKVELALRVSRHLPILLFDLFTKRNLIHDHTVCRHRSPPSAGFDSIS